MKTIVKGDFLREWERIGLKKGAVVMVHTSLKSLGYVCGGAQTVIESLLETVGDEGAIMMP